MFKQVHLDNISWIGYSEPTKVGRDCLSLTGQHIHNWLPHNIMQILSGPTGAKFTTGFSCTPKIQLGLCSSESKFGLRWFFAFKTLLPPLAELEEASSIFAGKEEFTMTDQEKRTRERHFMTLELGSENIKVFANALRNLGLKDVGYEPYGRRALLSLCDTIKDILSEMELADQEIQLLNSVDQ